MIEMNPLPVFGGLGELLDPFLRKVKPPGDTKFAPNEFFECSRIFQH